MDSGRPKEKPRPRGKDRLESPRDDLGAWVDRHLPVLYAYALRRVRRHHIAEELVQETFLAALKNHRRFAGRSREQTWLIGILRHKIVDFIRRDRETPASALESEAEGTVEFFDRRGHWLRPPKAWRGDPQDTAERQEFWQVFQRCLDRLPESLAHTFVLRELEQCGPDEVCASLGISAGNLWARLSRARLRLRECLEIHWFKEARR